VSAIKRAARAACSRQPTGFHRPRFQATTWCHRANPVQRTGDRRRAVAPQALHFTSGVAAALAPCPDLACAQGDPPAADCSRTGLHLGAAASLDGLRWGGGCCTGSRPDSGGLAEADWLTAPSWPVDPLGGGVLRTCLNPPARCRLHGGALLRRGADHCAHDNRFAARHHRPPLLSTTGLGARRTAAVVEQPPRAGLRLWRAGSGCANTGLVPPPALFAAARLLPFQTPPAGADRASRLAGASNGAGRRCARTPDRSPPRAGLPGADRFSCRPVSARRPARRRRRACTALLDLAIGGHQHRRLGLARMPDPESHHRQHPAWAHGGRPRSHRTWLGRSSERPAPGAGRGIAQQIAQRLLLGQGIEQFLVFQRRREQRRSSSA